MKLKEINKDFLNLHYKGKRLAYYKYDEYVYITDSYRLYKLAIDDLKLSDNLFTSVDLLRFTNEDGYVDAIITNDLVVYNGTTCRVIKNDNISVKVDDKYLKYFDSPEVKIKSEKDPIFIYENNEYVGLIMPIIEY